MNICSNSMDIISAILIQLLNSSADVTFYGEDVDNLLFDNDFDFDLV